MRAWRRSILAMLLAAVVAPAPAQDARSAQQRLETVRRELDSVAAERRKLEGERGGAARALRQADEAVGTSTRRLRETRQRLAADEQALADLQQRREQMQARLGMQREQLKSLLRAAYREREDAPLKALLAQDRLADANRVLTYHRYLQRHRAGRIAELAASVRTMEAVEQEIVARKAQLEATRAQLETELAGLQADRRERAGVVSGLDRRYRDRSDRERALGRDAKGLEQLLAKL
ncbi:murein hydrolase activator EnvC family protein, partial [Novilysobacter viscosus]